MSKKNKHVIDSTKLQELSDIASSINWNDGQNSVRFEFWPIFTSGSVIFTLDWKRDCGEANFDTLDEAIQLLTDIKKKTFLKNK